MLEVPAGTLAQFLHDQITIAQQVDVEIDMADRIARDVDLRDVFGQEAWDLRDWCNFHACSDDDN